MTKIRFVTPEDASPILDIYAPYVSSTTVTFETNVQRLYDIRRRIATISSVTPFLVCEIDGKIAGFSYADADSKRHLPAYGWNTNVYVYIHDDYQKCNIASALYLAMISLLTEQGYKKIIALVNASDTVSESFHLAFGFKKVGVFENLCWKLGRWHSVSIFEKVLDDSLKEPQPVKTIKELDIDFCQKSFSQCEKIIRIRK